MIRKRLLLVLIPLIFLMSTVFSIEQGFADITSTVFIGYVYTGPDPYYCANIIGYREGSFGSLIVTIKNDVGYDISLINLTLVFEWGDRFSAAGLPEVISKGTSKVYIIDFTVPPTTRVPHIRPYIYYIVANYTIIHTNESRIWIHTPTDYFAVLSKEQKEYYDFKFEFSRYNAQYPITWFTSVRAIELVKKAFIERDYADYFYSKGNFTGAINRFKSAIDFYKQAISVEISYRHISEEIGINKSILDLEIYKVNIEYLYSEVNISRAIAEAELIRAYADMKYADAQLKIAEAELIRSHAEFKRAEAEFENAKNLKYYALSIIVFGVGFIIISIGLMFRFMKK